MKCPQLFLRRIDRRVSRFGVVRKFLAGAEYMNVRITGTGRWRENRLTGTGKRRRRKFHGDQTGYGLPPGFKTTNTAQGHWYFKKSDLVDYIEARMR